MQISIEGPKGTGKSTAIARLVANNQDEFGDYEILHSTAHTETGNDFYRDMLSKYPNIIFDRYILGELVYPYSYGRAPKAGLFDAINLVRELDLMVISYSSDDSILYNRVLTRDGVVDSGIFKSNKEFTMLAYLLKDFDNVITIDVAKENIDEVLEEVFQWK